MTRPRICGVAVMATIVAGVIAMGFGQRSGESVFAGDKKAVEDQKKGSFLPPLPPLPGFSPGDLLRKKYLNLHQELSGHLTEEDLSRRVAALEREVAAAKDETQRMVKEKTAADEFEKVKSLLTKIAETYPDTVAGRKAQQALSNVARPPVEDKKLEEKKFFEKKG
jgi:hypothetical protein